MMGCQRIHQCAVRGCSTLPLLHCAPTQVTNVSPLGSLRHARTHDIAPLACCIRAAVCGGQLDLEASHCCVIQAADSCRSHSLRLDRCARAHTGTCAAGARVRVAGRAAAAVLPHGHHAAHATTPPLCRTRGAGHAQAALRPCARTQQARSAARAQERVCHPQHGGMRPQPQHVASSRGRHTRCCAEHAAGV
jgi:hypothetical protein